MNIQKTPRIPNTKNVKMSIIKSKNSIFKPTLFKIKKNK